MTKKGKKCLVLEKRSHIGGNVYTEEEQKYIEGYNYFVPYILSPASPRPGTIYLFSFNPLSTVAQYI